MEARTFFEPRFGHDFSQVRVHSEATAVDSARAVNAHAYTVGSSIVLGATALRADALEGQRLLAHELTHVVQQSGSAALPNAPIRLGQPGDSAEQEAEHRANGISAQ
jgi:hypothetical protein